MTAQLVVFAIASIAFVYVSRRSLRAPRSHGFYRFFAWEAIIALILLNLPGWFRSPFSLPQIISWILLTVALYLVAQGVYLLHVIGKPDETRGDATNLEFENTTHVVTVGAYKYIRHPLYSSLLFLAWGVFFKDISTASGALALAATAFLVATAKAEEREDIRFFGSEYLAYMERTKMFVPFVW